MHAGRNSSSRFKPKVGEGNAEYHFGFTVVLKTDI